MSVDVEKAISSVTLAGSVLSCLATTLVLISFIIYRRQLRSFRHILVLNLVLAEFINTFNNSVSGIIVVQNGRLHAGTPCVVNAFIGQLSVQAADFSVLAIAVVTLLTVRRVMYMPNASKRRKIIICVAVWILPVITSLVPTFMGEMTPVGGNWCWISASRPDLRYGLTHGWRILVIFSTITIYFYIWAYLRQHLNSRPSGNHESFDDSSTACNTGALFSSGSKKAGFRVMKEEEVELSQLDREVPKVTTPTLPEMSPREDQQFMPRGEDRDEICELSRDRQAESKPRPGTRRRSVPHLRSSSRRIMEAASAATAELSSMIHHSHAERRVENQSQQTNASEFPMRRDAHEVELEIKRMMLLNAYPILYVILWMPGLVNRLMEASGKSMSEEAIAALQAPTQFIGLANALTYGFNHHLRDRLKEAYLMPAISRVKTTFRR